MTTQVSPTAPTALPATPAEARAGAAELTYQPHVDIRDLGSEVVFDADIPGARADGIDVTFEDGVLAVRASVPPRDLPGRAVRQEYGIGNYRRSFRLGEGFDASQITADYRRGVLTIRVPRLAAVRPRKVEVRTG
jgi:HSP20 family protein